MNIIEFESLIFKINEANKIRLIKTAENKIASADKENLYTFVEVQIAGENHPSHHGAKYFLTSECLKLNYISHEIINFKGGRLLSIIQRSELIEVNTLIRSFEGTNAICCFNKVKNISDKDITLEYVSSFNYYGLGDNGTKSVNDLYFYLFTNSWHCECQPFRRSFFDYGLFNGNDVLSLKRISGSNTGSWSSKEQLPQGIIEDSISGVFTMFQIESSNSWYYEIGDNGGQLYLNLSGPNCIYNHFSKKLKPDDTYTTVKSAVCIGHSLDDVLSQMTMYRRKIVRHSHSNDNLPSIYNEYMHGSWNTPNENNTKLVANCVAKTGIKYYIIDCGWHDEQDDCWLYIGEWKESKKRFPSGFNKTLDYIRSLGLKVGFWLEIEAVGMYCQKMLEFYDKDCFFRRNDKVVINQGRYQLDFTNNKVLSHINSLFDSLMDQYKPDYIKIDYNQDSGPGTEVNSDSLGDGLEKHSNAFLKWAENKMNKYPDLIIEFCASGGQRMDYQTMSIFPLLSTSDQTDYKKYPYIAGNILSAVLPEQAAVWSYPVANNLNDIEVSEECVVMNMINSFLGRIHLASHIERLSENKLNLIKQGLAYYDKLISYKKVSVPIFPIGFACFNSKKVASGFKSGDRAFLAVWNTSGEYNVSIPLKNYNVSDIKVGYPINLKTDFTFAEDILTIKFTQDYQARFFELELN